MQQTIGNKIEAWAIQALRAAATLPFDLQVEAFNSSAETATERIKRGASRKQIPISSYQLNAERPESKFLSVTTVAVRLTKNPTRRSIQRRVTLQFEFWLPFPPWMS